MSITVKVGEAKTHLSALLAKVEAGEEVIIARGSAPIARLSRIRREGDVAAVIEEIKAARGAGRRRHPRRFGSGATKAGASDGRRHRDRR